VLNKLAPPDYEPVSGPRRATKSAATSVGSARSRPVRRSSTRLLWMIPNDPNWIIWEPYVDEWGREVRVLPRFKGTSGNAADGASLRCR